MHTSRGNGIRLQDFLTGISNTIVQNLNQDLVQTGAKTHSRDRLESCHRARKTRSFEDMRLCESVWVCVKVLGGLVTQREREIERETET